MNKKFYTEEELNAELDALEASVGQKIEVKFREIFFVLGEMGLFDAFCEICTEKPKEIRPDKGWFMWAVNEAQRRVSDKTSILFS